MPCSLHAQPSGDNGGNAESHRNRGPSTSKSRPHKEKHAKREGGNSTKGELPSSPLPEASGQTEGMNPWLRCIFNDDKKAEKEAWKGVNPAKTAEALFERGKEAEDGLLAALDGEALCLRALVPPT